MSKDELWIELEEIVSKLAYCQQEVSKEESLLHEELEKIRKMCVVAQGYCD